MYITLILRLFVRGLASFSFSDDRKYGDRLGGINRDCSDLDPELRVELPNHNPTSVIGAYSVKANGKWTVDRHHDAHHHDFLDNGISD